MNGYKLVIMVNMNQFGDNYQNPEKMLVLDVIENKASAGSSNVATHPMQNGDTIADHAYKNPKTYNVSGSFSLNGINYNDISYGFLGNNRDRLTDIQNVFEKISDEHFLCDLYTISDNDKDNSRFKIRKNYTLKNYSWVEGQNSMKYTFEFEEVMLVDQLEYEQLSDAEKRDLGIPDIGGLVPSSLGDEMVKSDGLAKAIIRTLIDEEYINKDFAKAAGDIIGTSVAVQAIAGVVAAVAIAVGLLVAKAVTAIAVAAGATAATASVVPVGTIIAAAAVATAALVMGIVGLVKNHKKKKKAKNAFKLINGSPEQDLKRLQNLIDDVSIAINNAIKNVTLYSFKSESLNQLLYLNVGGDYYEIEPKGNNTDGNIPSSIRVTLEDEVIADNLNYVTNFANLNRNQNLWFKDTTKEYEVYLLNLSLDESVNKTQEEQNNVKKILTQYKILVSKGDISKYIKQMQDVIVNTLVEYGFE